MEDKLPEHVQFWLDCPKHDCFFNVGTESGPNEIIGSFKILLMGHSEPLRKLLEESDLAEKGNISLPDIEPDIFKLFLKCIYGASDLVIKNMTCEQCAKLLYIAEKYLVTQLKKDVLERLAQFIPLSNDDLFVTLKHIVLFQDDTVNNAITDKIRRDTNTIFSDKKFLDISSEALLLIVEQNSLNVNELDVFNAVAKWAKNKANSNDGTLLRKYISKHLQFIRFRAISCEDFCANIIPTCVLTPEEACNLSSSLATKSNHKIAHFSQIDQSRNCQISLLPIVHYYIVQNLCRFEEKMEEYSNFANAGAYSWRFLVKRNRTHFSLFLHCKPRSQNNPSWECNASAQLVLVNQCGKADRKRSIAHKFNEMESDWGFTAFTEWDVVVDPSEGFIKNGNIVVVVYITF